VDHQKGSGRKGRGSRGNRDGNHKPKSSNRPQTETKPVIGPIITKTNCKPITIVKNNTPIESTEKPTNTDFPSKLPPPPPPSSPPNSTASPNIVVQRANMSEMKIQIRPEVEESKKRRKLEHTYTIEYLKSFNRQQTLPTEAVFQYHAELQLFKRNMTSRRSHTAPANLAVIQQRINQILLHFNSRTYTQVFNEILSIGIFNEGFVLSFVNVLFKQAVLNPDLALLFAQLAKEVAYVLKSSRSSKRLKDLLKDRCLESFAVPTVEASSNVNGSEILQTGIVTFAGSMARISLIPASFVTDMLKRLIQAGTKSSIDLAVSLAKAGGSVISHELIDQVDSLAEKATGKVRIVSEVVTMQSETGSINRDISKMTHSPSIDHALDSEYPKLFKRSDSIPQELNSLALDDEDTVEAAVQNFLYDHEGNLDIVEEKLVKAGLTKGNAESAKRVFEAIALQSEDAVTVVADLAVEMYRRGFYDGEMVKQALEMVVSSNAGDVKKLKIFAKIFALFLNEDEVSFDDFEPLFKAAANNWKDVIPSMMASVDEIRGAWTDEMLESEFFKECKFVVNCSTIKEKINELRKLDVLNYFPHFYIADIYAGRIAKDEINEGLEAIRSDTQADKKLLAEAVLELTAEMKVEQIKAVAPRLKEWIQQNRINVELKTNTQNEKILQSMLI